MRRMSFTDNGGKGKKGRGKREEVIAPGSDGSISHGTVGIETSARHRMLRQNHKAANSSLNFSLCFQTNESPSCSHANMLLRHY